MTRRNSAATLVLAALLLCDAQASRAADNQLTPQEKQAGWVLLFDGRSPAGWVTRVPRPGRTTRSPAGR